MVVDHSSDLSSAFFIYSKIWVYSPRTEVCVCYVVSYPIIFKAGGFVSSKHRLNVTLIEVHNVCLLFHAYNSPFSIAPNCSALQNP